MPMLNPTRSPSPLAAALALALAVLTAPGPALAAPAPADTDADKDKDSEPEADPALAEAQLLYEAGVARYAAADYGTAVDLWLKAYALLPATVDYQLIKAQLIYNVARAQQKWFEIDQDVKHLRQSKEILGRYRLEIDELYEPEAAGLEREKIDEQLEEVEAEIAAYEAEQARREQEILASLPPSFDVEADAREERRNKAMLGAGAGLTALGIGGAAMAISGVIVAGAAERQVGSLPLAEDLGAREAAIGRGRAGNALILTGSIAGAALLAAGVPLLVVSLGAEKKRKQRRIDAGLEAVAPILLPGGGGLGLAGRF